MTLSSESPIVVRKKKKAVIPKVERPKFTRQEYATIIDALSAVKMIGEASTSFVERRGARAILPNNNYHVGIIDKLAANTIHVDGEIL